MGASSSSSTACTVGKLGSRNRAPRPGSSSATSSTLLGRNGNQGPNVRALPPAW
ncbi:MAG: hypothetical protein RL685_795 [Pseudomonadota bacterium]|jgi:hypothetical protein